MTCQFCIVTDIHHGPASLTKCGDRALELVGDFVRWVDEVKPNAVLELGDRISDSDRDTDLRLESEVAAALRSIGVPVYHLNGNHDRDYLSVQDNEKIFAQTMQNEVVEFGDWHLVLWRADTLIREITHTDRAPTEKRRKSFVLDESDLIWLQQVIHNAAKPLLIASHVPVHEQSQIGNYYFQCKPRMACYPKSDRVRAVVERAQVPVVWIAGHVHWNSVTTINGIHYLTQQSLTESYTTLGKPAAAMGLLRLDEAIHWEVFGEDRFACTLAANAIRWAPPLRW